VSESQTDTDENITDHSRWFLLQEKAMAVRAIQAFSLMRDASIEPVLIKGLAAARFYPEPGSRASIDMDLAVAADDFEAADKIARSATANGLAIDLHRELRHLDTVEWNDLFSNSQLLDVEGGNIRVLCEEDHLRVLIVHWLTDGGARRERLWDFYYCISGRSPDFNWDRFLNSVSKRRRRWLICTVGLAHHYLGLDLNDTPIRDEARNLPSWLIKALEKEWANETPFMPLETVIHDLKMFLKQIPRRLQPNPIWATVQLEGSFDAKTRVFYQLGSFFQRIVPSYKRVSSTIFRKP